MYKLVACLLFSILLIEGGYAQRDYKPKFNKSRKEPKKPFPSSIEFRPGGWYLGLGLTATTGFGSTTETIDLGATTYDVEFDPNLRPWFMLEAGRFYNFKGDQNWIRYADFGIAYKGITGSESFDFREARLSDGSTAALNEDGSHGFSQHYISLNANLNNIIPLTDYNFIQNSFGVNADIRFLESFESDYPIGGFPTENPGSFVGQVHYALGFGYTYDTDRVLLVSLETPIFNLTPQEQNFSRLDFFNSSFQTFILRVRILLFRLANTKCPPVQNPDLPAGFKNGYGD